MRLQLTEGEHYTIAEVAETYKVDASRLEEMYLQILERNFFTDLCDVAMLNEEELKKGD